MRSDRSVDSPFEMGLIMPEVSIWNWNFFFTKQTGREKKGNVFVKNDKHFSTQVIFYEKSSTPKMSLKSVCLSRKGQTHEFRFTRLSQKFCNIFACASLLKVYHVTWAVQVVVGTSCGYWYRGGSCTDTFCIVSLHVWFESRSADRTIESNSEPMLYKFELGYNAAKSVDTSTVKANGSRNLDRVARTSTMSKSARPKTVDSEGMLRAIMANPGSSTWRVSGELDIS